MIKWTSAVPGALFAYVAAHVECSDVIRIGNRDLMYTIAFVGAYNIASWKACDISWSDHYVSVVEPTFVESVDEAKKCCERHLASLMRLN